MENPRKWLKPVGGLKTAVQISYPLGEEPESPKGVIDYPPPNEAKYKYFYLPMNDVTDDPTKMGLAVPESVADAPRIDLIITKGAGYRVHFLSAGEEIPHTLEKDSEGRPKPFEITLKGFPRPDEKPGAPLYVRVDHSWKTSFCRIDVGLANNQVTITVSKLEADNEEIPVFLKLLPEEVEKLLAAIGSQKE